MRSSSYAVVVGAFLAFGIFSPDTLASDPVPVEPVPDISEPGPSIFQQIDFEWSYTAEVLGNVYGGLSRGTDYLDLLELSMAVEGDAFLPWQGGQFLVRVHGTHGGSISRRVGDLQGLSNIEAPRGWRLFEAWFQQSLAAEKVSLLVGRYDVNSEFDSIESAQLFLNSSHGVGPEFGLSGLVGPSIFPFTTTAVRASYRPVSGIQIKGAFADGFAGMLDWEGTADDFLVATEIEVRSGRLPISFAAGYWSYSPWGMGRRGRGAYAYVERDAIEIGDQGRELAFFARIGQAAGRVSPVDSYLGFGMVWRNLRPGGADELGIALALAGRAPLQDEFAASEVPEAVLELTYKWPLRPWLMIQPDFQWIFNPGALPGVSSSLVVGGRFEFAF